MPNKKDDPLGLYSASEIFNVSHELDKETTLGLDFNGGGICVSIRKKKFLQSSLVM